MWLGRLIHINASVPLLDPPPPPPPPTSTVTAAAVGKRGRCLPPSLPVHHRGILACRSNIPPAPHLETNQAVMSKARPQAVGHV